MIVTRINGTLLALNIKYSTYFSGPKVLETKIVMNKLRIFGRLNPRNKITKLYNFSFVGFNK